MKNFSSDSILISIFSENFLKKILEIGGNGRTKGKFWENGEILEILGKIKFLKFTTILLNLFEKYSMDIEPNSKEAVR